MFENERFTPGRDYLRKLTNHKVGLTCNIRMFSDNFRFFSTLGIYCEVRHIEF